VTANDLLVMKFGGTSVGSVEAIRRAGGIVANSRAEWGSVVVVVSALSGVTNLLLETAARASAGDAEAGVTASEQLKGRHFEVAGGLVSNPEALSALELEIDQLIRQFRNLCGAVAILGEATPRALDSMACMGERLSVRIIAAHLQELGLPAQAVEANRLIVTDSTFQAAHPDLAATRDRCRRELQPVLDQGTVPVVTGFMAADHEGITTTLGRGGSDYSAALLGAALKAREVWIWTDVDGVMTADPRMVPEARTIPALSYLELAELAYFGAKVLHPRTIRPVVESRIGLRIKNTFKPDFPGTELLPGAGNDLEHVIKAVTAIGGQSLITIEGRGMLGVPGVAARAFGAVAATGTSVILISQASSEQSISFAVAAERTRRVVEALERAFATELADRDIDRIWSTNEVVTVTVVGSGMKHTPGVAGRVFSALGADGVNVIAIAQGSSEVSISLVVEAADKERAVRALHRLIV
jgi:bifunctional aspartokinase / homoserine dehydrogenase 1